VDDQKPSVLLMTSLIKKNESTGLITSSIFFVDRHTFAKWPFFWHDLHFAFLAGQPLRAWSAFWPHQLHLCDCAGCCCCLAWPWGVGFGSFWGPLCLLGICRLSVCCINCGSLPLVMTCLCVLETSKARRLSMTLFKSGTGLSLNSLSRPPSSVVPITMRLRISESPSEPNSHEPASCRKRTTNSSIVSPGCCVAELKMKRSYKTLRCGVKYFFCQWLTGLGGHSWLSYILLPLPYIMSQQLLLTIQYTIQYFIYTRIA